MCHVTGSVEWCCPICLLWGRRRFRSRRYSCRSSGRHTASPIQFLFHLLPTQLPLRVHYDIHDLRTNPSPKFHPRVLIVRSHDRWISTGRTNDLRCSLHARVLHTSSSVPRRGRHAVTVLHSCVLDPTYSQRLARHRVDLRVKVFNKAELRKVTPNGGGRCEMR